MRASRGLAVYVANLPGWVVFLAHAAIVSSRLKTSPNGNKGSLLRAWLIEARFWNQDGSLILCLTIWLR